MAVYSFDQKDSSVLAQNPLAGLLAGGFTFSPQKTYGGSGNSLSATPTATATLTPTQSNTTSRGGDSVPSTPFADGAFGFGGGAAVSAPSLASSLALPGLLIGGFILFAVAMRR